MSKNIKPVAKLSMPAATGININMMPFIMGDMDSIPPEYRHYAPIIEACNLPASELGKVLRVLELSRSLQKSSKKRNHRRFMDTTSWNDFTVMFVLNVFIFSQTENPILGKVWFHSRDLSHLGFSENLNGI